MPYKIKTLIETNNNKKKWTDVSGIYRGSYKPFLTERSAKIWISKKYSGKGANWRVDKDTKFKIVKI